MKLFYLNYQIGRKVTEQITCNIIEQNLTKNVCYQFINLSPSHISDLIKNIYKYPPNATYFQAEFNMMCLNPLQVKQA